MNAKNQKERQEDLLAWFEEEETIRAAEPTQIVTALAALEKACLVQGLLLPETDGAPWERKLLPLLAIEDWLVRAKTLLTIGRLGNPAIAPEIIRWLRRTEEPWWQLQGLDCWWQLPVGKREQETTLRSLIQWARQPVTVRGLVWLLRQMGTKGAAELFVEFVLTKKTMVVKAEFLHDAWFVLAETLTPAEKGELLTRYPAFRVWLNFCYPSEKPAHYGLYPSPDYLRQQALALGVDGALLKRIYIKPRKKTAISAQSRDADSQTRGSGEKGSLS